MAAAVPDRAAQRERAFAAHESGDLGAAERGYRELLRSTPDDHEIQHALGVLALQTGVYREAVTLICSALRAHASAARHADLGAAHLGLAEFDAALASFERALALEPRLAGAHLNRGIALRGLGRCADALESIEHALGAWPQFHEAHLARADLLTDRGRPAEAIASYEQGIALNPGALGAYLRLARALVVAGRWREALDRVDQALALGVVRSAEVFTLRGLALAGLERHEEALASYDAALVLEPEHWAASVNRGIVLRRCGRLDEARGAFDRVLAILPENVESLCNRAAVLVDLGRYEAALLDASRAAALSPGCAEIHMHRGTALLGLERFDEALAAFGAALRSQPAQAQAHAGLAAALQHLGRHEEALASAERAVALDPQGLAGHVNRAAALTDLLRIDEAVASLRTARALAPQDAVTNCNLGRLLLLRGDYAAGWPLYEWRSRLPSASRIHRFAAPAWDGKADLRGRTLFVHVDQGLGDTLQFARYLPLAARRGAEVVLAAQDGLRRLLSTLDPAIRILGESAAPASVDLHCPISSLPHAFGTRLGTIPAAVPYLSADAERAAQWRRLIGPEGFKIGVCWQGAAIRNGAGRAFALRALAPLAAMPHVRLVSLQRGAGLEQLDCLPGIRVESLPEHFDAGPDAFLDTAAVMQSLDLVITCDTSVAHLAGALGRPTWVMLKRVPDWRWMLNRSDSAWYPTLRLFRQSVAGRWEEVVAAMGEALLQRLDRRD